MKLSSPPLTRISKRRALVLLDRRMESELQPRLAKLKADGNVVLTIDYQQMMNQVEEIRATLVKHDLDFILFSCNDQIFDHRSIGPLIRSLRVGYSTFSAIDSGSIGKQTMQCLNDYLGSPQPLKLPTSPQINPESIPGDKTFSLIFDLEQLAGARFGLPRVLDLLHEFNVRANFFMTSVIEEVYPDTIRQLVDSGHEIGFHGRYHEYLSGLSGEEQSEMIRNMKSDFHAAAPIRGANFIYRMDNTTVSSMIANRIDYFVTFMEHRYAPFTFCQPPIKPMLVDGDQGRIWMVPVSVETYNRPWFGVKNMIDAATNAAKSEPWNHLNILCHPFRDGAQRHVGKLRRLLAYMTQNLGYRGAGLNRVVAGLPTYEPDCHVYYSLEKNVASSPKRSYLKRWWHNRRHYDVRIGNLIQSLTAGGHRPALCFTPPDQGRCFAVYPHLPPGSTSLELVELDPLQHFSDPAFFSKSWDQTFTSSQSLGYVPGSYVDDLKNVTLTMRPHRLHDITSLIPEFALRLGYRLTSNRNVF
jgi:peptidoglycan/xylan/chitin deacetylase (PgdA/CDA1 family)